jgi:eukaryotic-like serine/threonine-protein kinase
MSPEQADERTVDARSDLWSLGILYFEALTGSTPFRANTPIATLRTVLEQPSPSLRAHRPELPEQAEAIVSRALQKDPEARYQTAAAFAADLSGLLAQLTGSHHPQSQPAPARSPRLWIASFVALILCFVLVGGIWLHRSSNRAWAREQAPAQFNALINAQQPLAAQSILGRAEKILPGDPQLAQLAAAHSLKASINSSPAGARIEIQDYLTPNASWFPLGTTPLTNISIPNGYFRWRVSKAGFGESITAPETSSEMDFPLTPAQGAPPGMVYSPADTWGNYIAFIGWVGPYKLPAFYIDRFEVTNREYQAFVDAGGYDKPAYWSAELAQANPSPPSALFRDTTGRPGPATWAGGHYPEGTASLPVGGVSWYEAAAYANFAGKQLPVLAQWFSAAPPDLAPYTVQLSNISTNSLAAVGKTGDVGPFGTYDMAGNVREWVSNPVDNNLRFILGGSWQSPAYLYSSPEALSPFDRSSTNGIRCVRNLGPLDASAAPVKRIFRDFTNFKPATDDVFRAYSLLYDYDKQSPLNARDEGTVRETVDWREERITFNDAYDGERMAAYLFLPRTVKPPYQTVLFFPSARVLEYSSSEGGRELGDIKFFDYILQSGRAVMYPIYEGTYERGVNDTQPGNSQAIRITTTWYKDAARSLDYLATRPDIDSGRLGYLGVSMGSAFGSVIASLLQPRLKTAIFLDGGFFLDPPTPGGDQADFVTRLKIPVLMVNGRYDFTFPLDQAQKPFFAMLGTPPADKSHLVLDTPHDVTQQRPQLTHAVLDWLDRYLGRISN